MVKSMEMAVPTASKKRGSVVRASCKIRQDLAEAAMVQM